MRLLFIMDSPEYLRFYDSVIDEFAARGHDVRLGVSHGQERKLVGLLGLATYTEGVRVLGLVPEHTGMWGDIAYGLRGIMDFVRYLHPRFAAAPALRARMKRKILPLAFHWLDAIPTLPPRVVRVAERMLMAADWAMPVPEYVLAYLREQAPDVLLVSPLVTAGSEQVDWIKAARMCGIRTAVCIASWDNLTNKGLLRIEPDLVVVWNDTQKQEAHEFHYVPTEKIVTTGAQLFDRWFLKQVTRDRHEFCARVGLPDSRPYLLFTGSSSFISRSNIEVPFVRRWIEALRASDDPVVREAHILVRPHPYNYPEWDSDPIASFPGVTVYPPRRYNPVDEQHRADFFDSIYHCAAVVGVNTSAMIEAAIIGRPVLSFLTEEFARTQEGTIHFHHLLPENGGFVKYARTVDVHIRQLSTCLRNPADARAETQRFVSSFVRPHGVNRPATPIFVDAIESLRAAPAPPPASVPAWAYGVRPLIVMAAAVQFTVARLRSKPLRRLVPKRVRLSLHHADKAARRQWSKVRKARKQWQRAIVRPLRSWRS